MIVIWRGLQKDVDWGGEGVWVCVCGMCLCVFVKYKETIEK